ERVDADARQPEKPVGVAAQQRGLLVVRDPERYRAHDAELAELFDVGVEVHLRTVVGACPPRPRREAPHGPAGARPPPCPPRAPAHKSREGSAWGAGSRPPPSGRGLLPSMSMIRPISVSSPRRPPRDGLVEPRQRTPSHAPGEWARLDSRPGTGAASRTEEGRTEGGRGKR